MLLKKKLLIIDDNKNYLESLELPLKESYKVVSAENYDEAINFLNQVKPEIALIDIRLDDSDEDNTDGLKILKWIKENMQEISTFMMSAYKEFRYAEKALNLGAKHFFRKPIDLEELKKILKEKS